jgi:hypothetical protein
MTTRFIESQESTRTKPEIGPRLCRSATTAGLLQCFLYLSWWICELIHPSSFTQRRKERSKGAKKNFMTPLRLDLKLCAFA